MNEGTKHWQSLRDEVELDAMTMTPNGMFKRSLEYGISPEEAILGSTVMGFVCAINRSIEDHDEREEIIGVALGDVIDRSSAIVGHPAAESLVRSILGSYQAWCIWHRRIPGSAADIRGIIQALANDESDWDNDETHERFGDDEAL